MELLLMEKNKDKEHSFILMDSNTKVNTLTILKMELVLFTMFKEELSIVVIGKLEFPKELDKV